MNLFDVTVTGEIPAPAEKVFDVWIDPKSPGGPWFGAVRTILNPVVDGLYYFAVKWEGRIWAHYGRFLQIDRPRRVQYTWVSEGTKGLESVVNLAFDPRGDHTKVTLRHTGIPDDELGRQHQQGWTAILGTLADSLAPRPASAGKK